MADSKISGFLSKDTAGLPNWAWIVVLGAGIVAAYVVPKFIKKGASTSSTGATDTSGIGLAVDPTTGLPYAIEGLSPSGGLAGTGGAIGTDTGGAAPPAPPLPPPRFVGPPQSAPPPETRWNQLDYTVKPNDTISTIADWFGVTPNELYALNPSLNLQQYGLQNIVPLGILIHVHSPSPNAPASASVTPAVTAQRATLKAQWPGAA